MERQRIIQTANGCEYADLPPSKIVLKLADEGVVCCLRVQLLPCTKRGPERWSGEIRNRKPVASVYLNPEKQDQGLVEKKAA